MAKKVKKYKITTIGCQMNISDSERISGYLEVLGCKRAGEGETADIEVFTTCGVRQGAEDRVYGLIPRAKKANPKVKIILTGCLSERPDVIKRLKDKVDIWLPIARLPELAKELGEKNISRSGKNYLNILPKYSSSFSAFVPIGNGCDNFCAYCVVPYARGREIYRPAGEVLAEIKGLVKRGYKEITLIAQNVNSYKSEKIDFAGLLGQADKIPGDFWIRFATSHPKDMSDHLIKAIAEGEKICGHIHLPAQAGNNEILRRMNRKYTKEHYLGLIKKIRRSMPDISITTDIIVGFPGETKAQFSDTKKLFKEAKYDMAYIARYSPRPGTSAFNLKDNVSPEEKQKREEELMLILRQTALKNNKKYIGKTVKILIDKKDKKGNYYGHTSTNKNVLLNNGDHRLGEFVSAKIVEAKDFGLKGEVAG
jgi:tRNA-2-methylthio-N6-dimethylallyladenosine synthase